MVVALIIQLPPAPPITSMSPDSEMRMEGTIAEGGFSPRAEAEILFFPCGSKQGHKFIHLAFLFSPTGEQAAAPSARCSRLPEKFPCTENVSPKKLGPLWYKLNKFLLMQDRESCNNSGLAAAHPTRMGILSRNPAWQHWCPLPAGLRGIQQGQHRATSAPTLLCHRARCKPVAALYL